MFFNSVKNVIFHYFLKWKNFVDRVLELVGCLPVESVRLGLRVQGDVDLPLGRAEIQKSN